LLHQAADDHAGHELLGFLGSPRRRRPPLLLLLLLALRRPRASCGRAVCVWSRNLGRRDVSPPSRHRHRGRTADAAGVGGGRSRRPLLLILLLGRRLPRRLLLVPVLLVPVLLVPILLVPILLVASVHLLRLLWRLLPVMPVAVLRVAVLRVAVRRRRLPVVGVAILRRRLVLAGVAVAAVLLLLLLLLLLRGRLLLLLLLLRGRRGFRVDVLPLLRILVLLFGQDVGRGARSAWKKRQLAGLEPGDPGRVSGGRIGRGAAGRPMSSSGEIAATRPSRRSSRMIAGEIERSRGVNGVRGAREVASRVDRFSPGAKNPRRLGKKCPMNAPRGWVAEPARAARTASAEDTG
jgi:hypothetical protein